MAQIGAVIEGKYEILKLIGQGGMSKVYLAMDIRLNKQWAIKELRKNARDQNNEIVIQSAIAEVNMIKKLDHPSLPRIVDIIENKEIIYVVMDYIEGEPLSRVVKRYGAQPQELVIEWAKSLAQSLDYLHTRTPPIIYRDMKPSNVMLKPDGKVMLIDFGIAREFKEKSVADTVNLGTKGYAAPEQFGGQGQTDIRTDIYCLGVTLYHLLTGHNPSDPPYEIYPIRYWNPNLSGGLEYIIKKCTQQNPEDRYKNCAEVLYALDHFEEMDDKYKQAQKKKLKQFLTACAACVVFLIGGISAQIMVGKENEKDFAKTMVLAQQSNNDREKAEYLVRGAKLAPEQREPYLELINLFKADLAFTLEEETKLKQVMSANGDIIKKQPHYGEIAFEIGKLYWHYYEYGKNENADNQITRMKSAVQWFEDAVSYSSEEQAYYKMATVYRDIGKFNQDITLSIEEASDKGKYLPYFENMEQLHNLLLQNPNESDIVKLELYRVIIYALEVYPRKFYGDSVSWQQISSLYKSVKTELKKIEPTTDKTMNMKKEIQVRLKSAKDAILAVYQ